MTVDSRLLTDVATVFYQTFHTSKTFLTLTCLNINPESLRIGCNQARYVSRGTCSE